MEATKFISRIINYLILQLFISLIALPILIAWGLPFSMTSLIATALFAPFFTIFLMLSSIVFFTTIAGIPNFYILKLLDLISQYWLTMLSWEYGHIMITIIAPPMWILFLLPCITFAIFIATFPKKPYTCLASLSTLLLVIFVMGYIMRPCELTHTIPCHGQQVTILRRNNQTVLIDPGYIGRRNSAPSWVQYTLVPEIIRKTGSLTLEHVIVLAPNQTLFNALSILCSECQIHNIYLPKMTGELPHTAQIAYEKFMHIRAQKNISVHEIDQDIQSYIILPEQAVYIKPETNQIRTYHHMTYPKCTAYEHEKIYI